MNTTRGRVAEATVRKWVMRQPDRATLLVCSDAGPTAFGWQRAGLGGTCRIWC
ncbi:MAG: hypothetical protein M0Z54_02335 [Thermaerobacter sp.]|nr:hypothetical protein [Thermaerobacter sp.]